jgi:GTP diphosphokinase / guanosine-3',5'-bis(diphosphate) 3'-diphosphatase
LKTNPKTIITGTCVNTRDPVTDNTTSGQCNGNGPNCKSRPVLADAAEFFYRVNSYLSPKDRELVQTAFALARREHGNQRRKSGELFFTHPLTVAYYLSEYHLDAPALVAALLHDVAEDTKVSLDEIGPVWARCAAAG